MKDRINLNSKQMNVVTLVEMSIPGAHGYKGKTPLRVAVASNLWRDIEGGKRAVPLLGFECVEDGTLDHNEVRLPRDRS